MDSDWNADRPIYRQLRDRMVALILEQVLEEGQPLPSVRTVATSHGLNPLTILKAYRHLIEEGWVEKRRGRGLYVSTGTRQRLLAQERARFLGEEWPRILSLIDRLGLSAERLLADATARGPPAVRGGEDK